MFCSIYNFFTKIGNFIAFLFIAISNIRKIDFVQLCLQIVQIGYFSLPIVALTSIFTGAVVAIQSYVGFGYIQSQTIIAKIVVISIVKEIGPVLVGIVVSGRIVSAIAAELGSMKVTEQIDVLQTLSVNFYGYLVLPRILASFFAFPLIAIVADVMGVLGGYMVGIYKFDFNSFVYIQDTIDFLCKKDLLFGMLKCATFGFFATSVGCYNGINCHGGATGVGAAVTNSVVFSFVLILLFNYMMTLLMIYGM